MDSSLQPNILIVDDDQNLCSILSAELQCLKLNADYSLNGLDALNKINHNHYSLVILNVIMPGMKGDEVLSKIKEYDSSLPVIMLTGYSVKEMEIKCARLGAEAYFTKPYDFDELLDAIIKYFR